MKAVNLIPAEERRGAGGAGRSGGAVYALLGRARSSSSSCVLAAIAGAQSVSDKRAQLADTQAEATAAPGVGRPASPPTPRFATCAPSASQTVRRSRRSRFDWAHALHEVARTLPPDVSLTAMTGTVDADGGVDGAASDPLRTALPSPALEIAAAPRARTASPCCSSDAAPHRGRRARRAVLRRRRAGGSGRRLRDGRTRRPTVPQFSLTLFFKAPAGDPVGRVGHGTATGQRPRPAPPRPRGASTHRRPRPRPERSK